VNEYFVQVVGHNRFLTIKTDESYYTFRSMIAKGHWFQDTHGWYINPVQITMVKEYV
jgi:hypothetical protein